MKNLQENGQRLNNMLQRGDRKYIADKMNVTYQTVYMALKNPVGCDTDLRIQEYAEKLIAKRVKRAKRIAHLIEEKEKEWATDCGGIGNVN